MHDLLDRREEGGWGQEAGEKEEKDGGSGQGSTDSQLSTVTYCPAYLYPARPAARGAECVHPVENQQEELPSILPSRECSCVMRII